MPYGRRPAPSGPIEINLFEGSAAFAGREVALSDGEFAVLAIVAMNRQGLSREVWCDKLWPDRDSESGWAAAQSVRSPHSR